MPAVLGKRETDSAIKCAMSIIFWAALAVVATVSEAVSPGSAATIAKNFADTVTDGPYIILGTIGAVALLVTIGSIITFLDRQRSMSAYCFILGECADIIGSSTVAFGSIMFFAARDVLSRFFAVSAMSLIAFCAFVLSDWLKTMYEVADSEGGNEEATKH